MQCSRWNEAIVSWKGVIPEVQKWGITRSKWLCRLCLTDIWPVAQDFGGPKILTVLVSAYQREYILYCVTGTHFIQFAARWRCCKHGRLHLTDGLMGRDFLGPHSKIGRVMQIWEKRIPGEIVCSTFGELPWSAFLVVNWVFQGMDYCYEWLWPHRPLQTLLSTVLPLHTLPRYCFTHEFFISYIANRFSTTRFQNIRNRNKSLKMSYFSLLKMLEVNWTIRRQLLIKNNWKRLHLKHNCQNYFDCHKCRRIHTKHT
jgi:hypothetical protein